ncbi:adenosine-specific kinase [bacterium]|nr:adenosine-specific kinase [bacterium]
MDIQNVKLNLPEGSNIIVGQSHFIKSAEDLYEALIGSAPGIKFGLAFCEASGPCLIRTEGNDAELVEECIANAQNVGAGHTFFILLRDAFPINCLNAVKTCPEVCRIFCATANPVEALVARTEQGRGIIGVIDGFSPRGVESEKDKSDRKGLLRRFGYKL